MAEQTELKIIVRERFKDWQALYECDGSGRHERFETGRNKKEAIARLRAAHPELKNAPVESESKGGSRPGSPPFPKNVTGPGRVSNKNLRDSSLVRIIMEQQMSHYGE